MDMAAILIMWSRCGEQTFFSPADGGSIWNLALIDPVVSGEKTFEECGFIFLVWVCKTSDPWGGVIFNPTDIIWTILIKVYKLKLRTNYQRPGPSCFRQRVLKFRL